LTPKSLSNHKVGVSPLTGTLIALLIVAGSVRGAGQSTLRGRVLDSETGSPVAGALVRLKPGPPPFKTDSLGRFEAQGLTAGIIQVWIGAVGFDSATYTLSLPAARTVEGVFTMEFTGFQLPEVVVEARAEQLVPRFLDFERRRKHGMGAYFRWDEIRKQGFNSVGDALRTVRGVRMECNQETFECRAFMARAPQCEPVWWIDGMVVRSFHENTPIRDIYGIEIYRGPGEVPAEFSGSDAMCGVIVIWTKSRPYREQ
jgi:Carboxypeptidase regulatory-like domain